MPSRRADSVFSEPLVQYARDALIALSPRGKILFWNSGAEQLLGYPAAETVRRSIEDFIPHEHLQREREEFQKALSSGSAEFKTARRKADGTLLDVQVTIGAVRHAINRRVRFLVTRTVSLPVGGAAFEAHTNDLLEAARDAMIVVDRSGRIVFVNQQAEKLFAYPRDELLGNALEMLVPERYRESHLLHRNQYSLLPRRRTMGAGIELFARRKDGTEFSADITLGPFQTPQGSFVTAAIRDISAHMRVEEQQRQLLREASRLKSEFLANMSHELRTPLNAIMGFTALLLQRKVGPLTAVQLEYLTDVLSNSRHLLRLINDILDLAKIESGKMEFNPQPLMVASLVSEVCENLRPLATEKRITLDRPIVPDLAVTLDGMRFKQVLYNYLSNALKFTPEGGRVIVRVNAEGADKFRLEVEDTGIGIKPEDVERLFVEFEQLESGPQKRFPGTGLGLSLTKRIVEAQGGKVSVTSSPGRGSAFAAVLPRDTSPIRILPPLTPRLSAERLAGRSPILVVEQDPQARTWLTETLWAARYRVEAVATGAEAVSLCQRREYAAVALDLLRIKGGSSWGTIREIRSTGINRQTPVVLTTTSADRKRSTGFVLHDFLSKPLQKSVLLECLQNAGVLPEPKPVLVVDDDTWSTVLIEGALRDLGYRSLAKSSGEEALQMVRQEPPVAIILDLLMPGMNGFEFLDELRRTPLGRSLPVIIWTVKDVTPEERRRLSLLAQSVVQKTPTGSAALLEKLRPYLVAAEPLPPADEG